MRKLAWIAAPMLIAALAWSQVRGIDVLTSMAKTLNDAQTLSATYKVTPVPGVGTEYTIDLKKPGQARLESATKLMIATGTEIISYDKSAKSYSRKPQSPADLKGIFRAGGGNLFLPFFDSGAYAKVVNPKGIGPFKRSGASLLGVEFGFDGDQDQRMTLYVTAEDKMLRQAEYVAKLQGQEQSTVVNVQSINLNGDIADERFQWTPPVGAVEVKDDFKWLTNFDEALELAKKSKRMLLVDFYADW